MGDYKGFVDDRQHKETVELIIQTYFWGQDTANLAGDPTREQYSSFPHLMTLIRAYPANTRLLMNMEGHGGEPAGQKEMPEDPDNDAE